MQVSTRQSRQSSSRDGSRLLAVPRRVWRGGYAGFSGRDDGTGYSGVEWWTRGWAAMDIALRYYNHGQRRGWNARYESSPLVDRMSQGSETSLRVFAERRPSTWISASRPIYRHLSLSLEPGDKHQTAAHRQISTTDFQSDPPRLSEPASASASFRTRRGSPNTRPHLSRISFRGFVC